MPEFNLKHPAARAHLLEVAQFWLQAGADGFRLDYANGPTHDFWADFRRTCRTTKPDCWLFGEVIHNAETLRSYVGLFDGTLDFLLAQALRETFAQGRWDLAQFEAFLTGHEHFFPADFMRPAFLDNHDMNRFLFLAQGDTTRLILAALVLFTLTGPPIIYYGTEVGMTQERPIHGGDNTGRFEDARLPMRWGAQQNTELHQVFQQLARLRSASPILRTGTRRVLHLDAAAGSYAYIRESSTDPHCVLVALNLSSTARQILLAPTDLPRDASIQFGPAQIEHSNDQIVLHIPARSGVWIA